MPDGFDHFWQRYPRRTAKLDALKAWGAALRIASVDQIMAGVERYRESENVARGYICHPGTWLRQGRWMDEEDTVDRRVEQRRESLRASPDRRRSNLSLFADRPEFTCTHDPRCTGRAACQMRTDLEAAGSQAWRKPA